MGRGGAYYVNSAIVACLLIAATALYYWLHADFYLVDFLSDTAASKIYGREMVATGTLFLRGWFYNNGDILTTVPFYFAYPFALMGFKGYELHVLEGVFRSLTLLLATVFFYTRLSRGALPLPLVLIAAIVFTLPMGLQSSLFTMAQGSYVAILIACLVFLGVYSHLDFEKRMPPWSVAALLLIAFLITVSGIVRAAASFWVCLVPMLVNSALSQDSVTAKQRTMLFGLALLIVFPLGYFSYFALVDGLVVQVGAIGLIKYASADALLGGMAALVRALFYYFGFDSLADARMTTSASLIYLLRICFAAALFTVGSVAMKRLWKLGRYVIAREEEHHAIVLKSDALSSSLVFAAVGTLMGCFLMVFSQLGTGPYTLRYAFPGLEILRALTVYLIVDWTYRRFNEDWIRVVAVTAVVVALCAVTNLKAGGALLDREAKQREAKVEDRFALFMPDGAVTRYLVSQNVTRGFASYGNASIYEVISDEVLRIGPVWLGDEQPRHYPVLTTVGRTCVDSDFFMLFMADEIGRHRLKVGPYDQRDFVGAMGTRYQIMLFRKDDAPALGLSLCGGA